MKHFARFGTIFTIKKMWKTHGGVLLLKLQALTWNFITINTPPRLFYTELYKWYQSVQRSTCLPKKSKKMRVNN